jgi:Ca-activated chloride channel homolog
MKVLLTATMTLTSIASGQNVTFKVDTRLVEVYATIRDHDGHFLDGLPKERFEVRDNGEPRPLAAFESNSASFSCAILLDTTGSMAAALPIVKNSVVKLIEELRENDSVAIYSFSTGLNQLQDFTSDKSTAKQAVLRIRAAGATALFDAISELALEVTARSGKKAIVVFTDGEDNASLLNARSAIQRAKKAGVPVYAIAEGEALKSKMLLEELKDVAEMTGAQSYRAHKTSDIAALFQQITGDLQHTYMLAYKPPPSTDQKWRTIGLTVIGLKGPKIRAKEGYLPE